MNPSKHRYLTTIGVLLLLFALAGSFYFFTREAEPALATSLPASVLQIEDEDGVIVESNRPDAARHEEMLFLHFQLRANRACSLVSSRRISAAVKHQRSLRGKSGIYYRSLGSDGAVLADGVLPDPLAMHYRLGESVGGVLQLEETEFVVRLPAIDGSAKVELFTVTRDESARSEFASPHNRLGVFPISL